MTDLEYRNRTGRPGGRVVRALGLVVRGIPRVQAQAAPYAEAWYAENLRTLASSRRRWVVLGDSMSQGVGAPAHDRGWVGQLHGRLAALGHDLAVLNLSAVGARVDDVLDQQLPAWESVGGPRDDDLVTVMIGSNDLFGGRRTSERLAPAFAELLERLPHGAVVSALPQPRDAARAANRHLDAAAAAGRVRLVDLRQGPHDWRGRLAEDFFHPNERGYEGLADAFEPVVVRELAR